MARTKEEKERLLRIISSIHCLWDTRPSLDDKDREHLDALVKRLVEMVPEDLRVLFL